MGKCTPHVSCGGIMRGTTYSEALEILRAVLARAESDAELRSIIAAKDEVLGRYHPIFDPARIDDLKEADFRSFLLFENNKHWRGIHRHVNRLKADMERLRETLKLLLDERRPITERLDQAFSRLKGLGKAVATPILLVAYPDRYGVWNAISEEALKRLGLWPEFERGTTAGQKYERINALLNQLARDLEIDLWTLDALFWRVPAVLEEENLPEGGTGPLSEQRFGLERYLHEFLRDNWEYTELGREWTLYSEPGDEEAGYEFPTDVGRIDLLAKHKTRPEWLVIELKRGRSTDKVIGQVLRYMGWVERHMAEPGEKVRGMIIAHTVDQAMLYALSAVGEDRVMAMEYVIDFQLKPVKGE